MVRTLAKPGGNDHRGDDSGDAHLLHMAVEISGESVELLDAVKKRVVYRKELDRQNVIEELGDLEFYMEGVRQELGVTREECLLANKAKLLKRYENLKYSDAAARDRADKRP